MKGKEVNKLKNNNILISGAIGLIGSVLIKTLLDLNEKERLNMQIIALIRSGEKAKVVLGKYYDFTISNTYVWGGGGATP